MGELLGVTVGWQQLPVIHAGQPECLVGGRGGSEEGRDKSSQDNSLSGGS